MIVFKDRHNQDVREGLMVDKHGEPLFVGDIVRVFNQKTKEVVETQIVSFYGVSPSIGVDLGVKSGFSHDLYGAIPDNTGYWYHTTEVEKVLIFIEGDDDEDCI